MRLPQTIAVIVPIMIFTEFVNVFETSIKLLLADVERFWSVANP